MGFFKRLKFAWKYNIEPGFIVYCIPDQTAVRFLDYDEAKKFSESQIQYRPNVLVEVEKL